MVKVFMTMYGWSEETARKFEQCIFGSDLVKHQLCWGHYHEAFIPKAGRLEVFTVPESAGERCERGPFPGDGLAKHGRCSAPATFIVFNGLVK